VPTPPVIVDDGDKPVIVIDDFSKLDKAGGARPVEEPPSGLTKGQTSTIIISIVIVIGFIVGGAAFFVIKKRKDQGGTPGEDYSKDRNMTSTSKAGLMGAGNNSTYIENLPGLETDDGFKKKMTKQELIEKEKKEIEAIKLVL
jgi:hypothetical protein